MHICRRFSIILCFQTFHKNIKIIERKINYKYFENMEVGPMKFWTKEKFMQSRFYIYLDDSIYLKGLKLKVWLIV